MREIAPGIAKKGFKISPKDTKVVKFHIILARILGRILCIVLVGCFKTIMIKFRSGCLFKFTKYFFHLFQNFEDFRIFKKICGNIHLDLKKN